MAFANFDRLPEQPLDEEDYDRYTVPRKKKHYGNPYEAEEHGYSYEWPEQEEENERVYG